MHSIAKKELMDLLIECIQLQMQELMDLLMESTLNQGVQHLLLEFIFHSGIFHTKGFMWQMQYHVKEVISVKNQM